MTFAEGIEYLSSKILQDVENLDRYEVRHPDEPGFAILSGKREIQKEIDRRTDLLKLLLDAWKEVKAECIENIESKFIAGAEKAIQAANRKTSKT